MQIVRRDHPQLDLLTPPPRGADSSVSGTPTPILLLDRDLVGRLGDDPPILLEIILRPDRAPSPDLLDQELADILLSVVDHWRIGDHRVPTTTTLAVVVDRHRAAMRRRDPATPVLQLGHPLADWTREVDRILDPAHRMEVVARDREVRDRLTLVGRPPMIVCGRLLEELPQLGTCDPGRAWGIVVD